MTDPSRLLRLLNEPRRRAVCRPPNPDKRVIELEARPRVTLSRKPVQPVKFLAPARFECHHVVPEQEVVVPEHKHKEGLVAPSDRRRALETEVLARRARKHNTRTELFQDEVVPLPLVKTKVPLQKEAEQPEERPLLQRRGCHPPYADTHSHIFQKRVVNFRKERIQRLRDLSLMGKNYDIVTHAQVKVLPSQVPEREDRRLAHASQQSLERGRNLQGSLLPKGSTIF